MRYPIDVLVRWIAAVVALAIVVGFPLTTYLNRRNAALAEINAAARVAAADVTQFIGDDPKQWRYQVDRLRYALQQHQIHDHKIELLDLTGANLVTVTANVALPEFVTRRPVYDYGQVVASIAVTASQRPALIATATAALLGLLIGAVIYFPLRILPLQALQRSREDLLRANATLENRVRERTADLDAAVASSSESEQRLRALLDGMPDRAWLKDTQGRYIALNRSEEQALGLLAREVIGKTVLEFRPRDQAEQVMAEDAAVMAEGRLQRFEEISNIDGAWCEKIKTPIMGADGAVAGIVGISRDISERKRNEEERRARDQAQKRTFVREIHHRIKNHVQGVAELLRGHARREPALTGVISAAVSQLQSVAVVHGLQGATEAPLTLGDMIAAICAAHSHSVWGGVRVDYQSSLQSAVTVGEDEAVPLALIVNELVLNAVKHGARERFAPQVSVRLESAEGGARIVIINDGRIAQSLRDTVDTGDAGGTLGGSGLRIVRSLLPASGARFDIRDDSDGVCALLTLWPPVVKLAGWQSGVQLDERTAQG